MYRVTVQVIDPATGPRLGRRVVARSLAVDTPLLCYDERPCGGCGRRLLTRVLRLAVVCPACAAKGVAGVVAMTPEETPIAGFTPGPDPRCPECRKEGAATPLQPPGDPAFLCARQISVREGIFQDISVVASPRRGRPRLAAAERALRARQRKRRWRTEQAMRSVALGVEPATMEAS